MNKQIWKYTIDLRHARSTFPMPTGARVLSVQNQNEALCLWALVDADLPQEQRHFVVAGTGHPLPPFASTEMYVGTVQLIEGALVLHVFEVGNLSKDAG